MKIAIVGYGEQGRAAYDYWNTPANQITICDRNTDTKVPEHVQTQLGDGYLQELNSFDLIVRSPALHPSDLVAVAGEDILAKVTTVTNEFFKVCPTKQIIGITGTKGKGTTSTLIASILESAGKRVHLGGNIGTPPLDLLKKEIQPEDWVVLELANFQLIDLKYSPPIAVCLMVVAEHMDWHQDMAEYIAAKQQLFSHQKSTDTAIYFAGSPNSKQVTSMSPGRQIPYFTEPGAHVSDGSIKINGQVICRTNEIKLLGKHNLQNVCAAVTATWQVSQDITAINKVLTTFSGLEHRLEFVREVNGVKYYDDSFGTTPETAVVAIEAFDQPKVVILGGSDKGADYSELAKAVTSNNVRKVILIGNTAHPDYQTSALNIQMALQAQKFSAICSLVKSGKTAMPEIVAAAKECAQPGDVVLLSAASASFDLFKNYKDRGEQFKEAVQALV